MAIFGRLAAVLGEQGSVVMIYLVACILERLFGKETVEDIEAIRGELTISDIIDGISTDAKADDREMNEMEAVDLREDAAEPQQVSHPTPLVPSSNGWMSSSFASQSSPPSVPTAPPVATSAFAGLVSTPNVFGTPSIFGGSIFSNWNQPLDDREVDETEELESDDWQEDATEPQQVPPSTQLKPSSDGWLSSSFTSQSSTAPAPAAPPVATPAFTGLVSTPNVSDMPSIFGNSAFSGLNQLPTSALSDTQPQAGFDGPVASTSISVVPTIVVDEVNSTEADDWQKDATGKEDATEEDATEEDATEKDATEKDPTEKDATEPPQVSLPAPLKPTSNGWSPSSFVPQSSTSTTPVLTTPVLTTPPVATSDILELVATPNVVSTPSIFGSSALTQQQSQTNGMKRISTTAFASGEDNSPHTQRKRVRRRISSQYHPPRTDEELAKRFKEVQSVLVDCFSSTFNGPDGFSFFLFLAFFR
jgi:hypothetical protein